jgi:hypothetical protein
MIQRSPESPPLLIDLERIELPTNSTNVRLAQNQTLGAAVPAEPGTCRVGRRAGRNPPLAFLTSAIGGWRLTPDPPYGLDWVPDRPTENGNPRIAGAV